MEPDPLRVERLLARLPARRRLARRVEVAATCASTQDELRARLERDGISACDGCLLAAEHQTGGRGRTARDWWSGPPCSNLAVTLGLAAPPHPPEALGLLAACALAAALRPWVGSAVAMRWPNDVLLAGRKVAGLLAELPAGAADAPSCALLGVGVNVRAAPPPEALARGAAATSVVEHARRPVRRGDLLALWLVHLERRLEAYEQAGPMELEGEFLALLRAWAPHGVRAAGGGPAGPVLEFSVSRGLTWGPRDGAVTRPLGSIPALEPLHPLL